MSEPIKYPVAGMTKMPAFVESDPLMGGCFVACAVAALDQQGAIEAFQRDSGMNLASLLKRSPIQQMVDSTAGYDKSVIAAWFDWVAENVWGIAGRDDKEDEE